MWVEGIMGEQWETQTYLHRRVDILIAMFKSTSVGNEILGQEL